MEAFSSPPCYRSTGLRNRDLVFGGTPRNLRGTRKQGILPAVLCNIEPPAQMPGHLGAWKWVPGSAAQVRYQSSVEEGYESCFEC